MNAMHSRNVGGGCRVRSASNTAGRRVRWVVSPRRRCSEGVDGVERERWARGGGVWKAVMRASASKRVAFIVALVRRLGKPKDCQCSVQKRDALVLKRRSMVR